MAAIDIVRIAAAGLAVADVRNAATPPAVRGLRWVLVARQVTQAVVISRTGWRASSASVDLLHALSMLPVVVLGRGPLRGAALRQAVTAAVLLVGELRTDARTSPRR